MADMPNIGQIKRTCTDLSQNLFLESFVCSNIKCLDWSDGQDKAV